MKTTGIILLMAGCVMLIAAIFLAFAVGGPAVWILTLLSILTNTAGITLLRGKF